MIIDMQHVYPSHPHALPHTLPKLFFIWCRIKDFSAACPMVNLTLELKTSEERQRR
jgi:hypothetical protein